MIIYHMDILCVYYYSLPTNTEIDKNILEPLNYMITGMLTGHKSIRLMLIKPRWRVRKR